MIGWTEDGLAQAWRALARLHMWQKGYPLHVMHGYAIPAKEALEFQLQNYPDEARKGDSAELALRIRTKLNLIMVLSWLMLAISLVTDGQPPLWLFLTPLVAWFFCIGFIFGNINAMAMESLGHVAGSAAAIIGTLTTLLAVGLGYLTGRAYDGTVLSLVTGFAVLTTVSVALTRVVARHAKS